MLTTIFLIYLLGVIVCIFLVAHENACGENIPPFTFMFSWCFPAFLLVGTIALWAAKPFMLLYENIFQMYYEKYNRREKK